MEEQSPKRESRVRQVIRALDLVSLIPGLIFGVLYGGISTTKSHRLYTPPGSPAVKSPHPGYETIPSWAGMVIVIGADVVAGVVFFFLSRKWPNIFRKFNVFTYIWTGAFAIGATGLCTDVFKSFVGRPRPDTEAVCGAEDMNNCLNMTGLKREDQFKSWPSGHSSNAMSGLLFGAFFVQGVFVDRNLWSSMISFLYIMMAVYIGASRVVNYRHNPDDVACGFLIGAIFAIVIWENAKKRIFREFVWNKEEKGFISEASPML